MNTKPTKEQLEKLAEYQAMYRADLSSFIQKSFSIVDPGATYLHNWHIDLIADYLMAVYKRDIKRLIINIPPGYLKSIAVNVAWPAWVLGHNPSERILSSSYSGDLSRKHSVDCRFLMSSDWYKGVFKNTAIAPDQNEKSLFKTTAQGFREAVSVGGTITGTGGNILIVDDPISAGQANSDVEREAANHWFDNTWMSRARDKKNSAFVVIMQRLHTRDLTGYLMEEKTGWEHLVIPGIAEKDTTYYFNHILGAPYTHIFKAGTAMHPEREDLKQLDQVKIDLGPYAFAGQYQQRPTPLGGGEFRKDWIQHYENVTNWRGMNRYLLVDPAGTKKGKHADYTAMVVIGMGSDKNYYILDMVRDRLGLAERMEKLFELHEKWKPKLVGYERYGMQTDIDAIRMKQEDINYRFPIQELKGTKLSKEDRIRRMIPDFAAKRVYLPKYGFYVTNSDGMPVDIVKGFIEEEYIPFPVGIHDDMFDAIARIKDPEMSARFPERGGLDRYDDSSKVLHLKKSRKGWMSR